MRPWIHIIGICLVALLLLLFAFYPSSPGYRVLATNIGYLYAERALFTTITSDEQRNDYATKAVAWFERSGQMMTPEQTLVFDSPVQTIDLAETAPLTHTSTVISFGNERATKYGEAIVFKNIPSSWPSQCVQIVHMTANSTMMPQASLLGYAITSLDDGRVLLQPLQIGIDTAEWAYDSPDIPPRHLKPASAVPLETGGHAYITKLDLPSDVKINSIAFVFRYPIRWHVEPLWGVRELQLQASC